MSTLTIHNKSDKYGDLHMGYYVCEQIASISGIDLRNPAAVKFARLLLGNSEAVRDSIDDIVSYASKSNGLLDFKPNTEVPETAKAVIGVLSNISCAHGPLPPGVFAYITAHFAAICRGEFLLAYELLVEMLSDTRSGFCDLKYPFGVLKDIVNGATELIRFTRGEQKETNK